jgi:DNA-binding response OmpR family regulator
MKILVLEDNIRLATLIVEALEQKKYSVTLFSDGKEALSAIDDGYDCFVLDINVPGMDGIALLHEIRSMNTHTPAIIISATIELDTIQEAYKKGCDEYLKKPFYMYELEMKIEKLCKPKQTVLKLFEGFSYDSDYELLRDHNNEEVKLAKKEILLLNLFAKNLGKTITFERIEQYVWAGELTTTENIRALIKRLRKKLPEETIENQGGMGYRLNYVL